MNIKTFFSKYRGRSVAWYLSTPLFAARIARREIRKFTHGIFTWLATHCFKARPESASWRVSQNVEERRAIRRILWIRLDHIGDILMTFPALDALCDAFPDAQVDALIAPDYRPVLEAFPKLHEVLTYTSHNDNRKGRPISNLQTLRLVRELRRRQYDLVFDARGDDAARLLAFSSGAALRVGPRYNVGEDRFKGNFAALMTHAIYLKGTENPSLEAMREMRSRGCRPHIMSSEHAIDNHFALLAAIGIARPEKPFRLVVTPNHRAKMESKLRALKIVVPFAIVHAASFFDLERNWNIEKFSSVADYLWEKHRLQVVLTGTSKDISENEKIRELSIHKLHIINGASQFTLAELPALMQCARIMVTVDTGPMHYAAMVSTPLVALMLNIYANLHGPYLQSDGIVTPVGLRPQAGEPIDYFDTPPLDQITVATVIEAIEKKLKTTSFFDIHKNTEIAANDL